MAFSHTSILVAIGLVLATTVVVQVDAACSPATVVRLSLDTPTTDFTSATTISLSPVVVRTTDSTGGFIDTGVVQVTISAPTGVTMSVGTATTLTTSAGVATFTGIQLTNPPLGSSLIKFDLVCSSSVVRSEYLEVIVTSGSATSVKFFTTPELSITNFGTFPITPQLAYYDSSNSVTDMLDTINAWTLTTNNTALNAVLSGNVITPSLTSGPIVSFDNIRFNIMPGQFDGVAFDLFLSSIGSNVGTGTITFPSVLKMKVAKCRTDYGIGAGNTGASNDNQVVQGNSGGGTVKFAIRGWGTFLSSSPGACRFAGSAATYTYVDVCNIQCTVPGTYGTRGDLSFALDGVAFYSIGMIYVVGPISYLRPESDYFVLYRQQLTYTSVHFATVDQAGHWLGDVVPAGYNMQCYAMSSIAQAQRVTTTYVDTYTSTSRTPSIAPALVRGNATVDFVFNNYLDPDRYIFCCNATGLITNSSCFTIEIREDCTTPPVITSITTGSACSVDGNGDLSNCLTDGSYTITVKGSNFGYSGARLRVGPRYCDTVVHDPASPARQLLASGCRGKGGNHTVLLLRPDAKVYALWTKKLHFTKTPVITSIVGCLDFYPSTANCKLDGSNTVMITGQYFGTSGATVYFYYYDPPGAVPRITAASTWHITGKEDTQVNATGFPGSGSRFAIAVQAASGELGIETEVTMSFEASVVIPCPKVSNIQCNNKGTCNTAVGTCTCFADGTNGFWAGAACDQCKTAYFGATCTGICPGGTSNPCSGAAQGTCSEGLAGTGLCTCLSGYGGTACQTACPGGVASPCSNHGTCVQQVNPPTCTCAADNTNGYWAGATCSTCTAVYVGTGCTAACPTSAGTPTTPCSGHGACSNTASGAACSCSASWCGADCSLTGVSCGACPAGKFGATCSSFCPGYASSGAVVCTGHGTCSQGTAGTGTCFCTTGFAGLDCSLSCATNTSGIDCSGAGYCDSATATCVCNAGYAGPACSISCPGRLTAAGICSGHGTCNGGDGTCSCSLGYTNNDCSGICPGGLSSPCSNHGTCQQNATCTCHYTQMLGYWSGTECSTCAAGWYSGTCNRTCLTDGFGHMCGGHGACTHDVVCACNDNSVEGYWRGTVCTECQQNYWGADCRSQCPGGACNSCSGNGICSDGVAGAGTCACFSNSTHGYWTNAKCDTCVQYYYGLKCTNYCPTGGVPAAICSGHGSCSDGIRGTGACACIADSIVGFWGGANCGQCLSGYYGPNCTSVCPGSDGLGTTCSGHGACNDGFAGTGTCTCNIGWGRSDCSSGCTETSPSVFCSGNGVCLDGAAGNGTCACHRSAGFGYWSESDCSDCLYGYYGASCIQLCPNGYGSVCSGHGTCDSGKNNTGKCSCDAGWSGKNCARPCDGGHVSPCSNHGVCNQADGKCTCDSSTVYGYWAGKNCSRCSSLYNSSDCTVACPVTTANPTLPCDGHGLCYEGICSCFTGYCGDKCELTGSDCLSECPEGYYGSDCTNMCPGTTNNWCYSHGACSQGLKGTGRCSCYSGYWDTDCNGVCPGGAASPCSGHGNCDQTSGTCGCRNGWATDDCSVQCPGGEANVCNGNGGCLPTTGTCECTQGYAGLACEMECPGGAMQPCNKHGTCDVIAGNCTCSSDSVRGYWNGTACDSCQNGYFGNGTCTKICVNGYTNGTTCICYDGWSGSDCTKPCPGTGSALGICSGHGTCLSGHMYATGICVCEGDYFTADCSINCSPAMCAAQPYYLVNGQCNNATGRCDCIQNNTHGYWTDTSTRCTTCKLFWWGPQCTQRCPCLERGGCDKNTGACQCFDSDADGHFAGVACERCKTGFLGAECKGKDVVITRQKPCSSIAAVRATSPFMILDKKFDIMITGARPLVFCNLTTRTLLGTFEFGGNVIAGHIHDDNNYIFTLAQLDNETDGTAQQQVRIRRELRPTFVIQGASAKYTTSSNAIAHSGVNVVKKQGESYVTMSFDSAAMQANEEAAQWAAATSRKLQTVHFYTHPVVVKTISLSPTEFLTIMSNGVVTRTVGLNVVGQYNFGAFFDQVMAADVTSTLLISPSLLFLGGKANNTDKFQLISVKLPLDTSNTIQVLTADVEARAPYCGKSPCRAIASLISDGTYVLMAMLTKDGAGIMRFRYTQLFDASYTVESNALLSRYDPATVVNVTAMLIDPLSSAGFIAVNLQSPDTTEPSVIYKFDLLDLQVYGSVRFQKVVTNYEIVTALSKDDVSRILFATVPLELQINVVPLNLYAVTKVYPHIADTAGGTVVTVEGEGFINDNFLRCDFNGTIVSATYISSREALCTAPVGGDERCEGVPLEITVQANQYTKNNVLLRRVSSPRITKVYAKQRVAAGIDNAYGNITGGEVVVLEGFGFQDSPFLACRFSSEVETQYARYADRDYSYSTGLQGVLYNNARFINATRMECDQPKFTKPTKGNAIVEVTLDGTVYSDSKQAYEVVGPAVGIKSFVSGDSGATWRPDLNNLYASGDRVELPDINVFVTDSAAQRLRSLDGQTRRISVQLTNFSKQKSLSSNFAACDYPPADPGTPVFHTSSASSKVTVGGKATFSGIYFLRPPAGVFTLTFTDESTGWSYNHDFSVDVGPPHRLKICKEPPTTLNNNYRQLTEASKLYVEDISGNQLAASHLAGIRVEARYLRERTETLAVGENDRKNNVKAGVPITVTRESVLETRVAELQDDLLKFDGLEMTGLYGKEYRINFTAPGLINVTSRAITVDWCVNRTDEATKDSATLMYFAKLGTSECFVCPTGGWCDGTSNVLVKSDNYWRPTNDSYKFYSCSTEEKSGDSCVPPAGSCVNGYEGARCSVCNEGWGHQGNFCKKCATDGEVVGYMLLIVIITLIFVAILCYTSLTSKLSETLPVVIKIAINHFQVASRVNEIIIGLPPVLKDIFDFQLQISELIRFDIVSTECAPLKLTIYGKFYLVMAIPVIIMVIFGVGLACLALWRQQTGNYIKYQKIEIGQNNRAARRDRVMTTIAIFISKLRAAASAHAGDMARDDLRKQFYTCTQYFSATAIIILCLVYPSMLQWCVTMWDCDVIASGDAETYTETSYLRVDRRVICTDYDHQVIQIIAIVAALVYGFVVPSISIFVVWLHWREYGRVHARHLYFFVTAGYDVATWFWEAVVMARKAAIVFIIIFVRNPTLRVYLAMWAMTLALGMHGWFQPYDPRRPSLYYLEGLGITTIVVTLNLALLFQFDYFAHGQPAYTTLVIFLVVINAITLVVFGFTIMYNLFLRFKTFIEERKKAREAAEAKEKGEGGSADEDTGSTDEKPFGEPESDEFVGVDRHIVQREGILGAIRRASRAHLGMKETGPMKKIDVRTVPKNDHETPLERLNRLEAERKKEEARESHVANQAELEKELEELRNHMLRAQALAAAEEAVIARFPEVAKMREEHEAELYRLMDEIRRERGDFAVGGAADIVGRGTAAPAQQDADKPMGNSNEGSVTARDASDDGFEMNFDDE